MTNPSARAMPDGQDRPPIDESDDEYYGDPVVSAPAAVREPTSTFRAMIDNLVSLDKQRTPGPWRKSHEAIGAPGNVAGNPHHLPLVAECNTDFGMYKTLGPLQAGKNARFIVALENAWPKLLAALATPEEASTAAGKSIDDK